MTAAEMECETDRASAAFAKGMFDAGFVIGSACDEVSDIPLSVFRTCQDCGLADWHQTFETLVSFINKCPRCDSLRLKSEMKRRKL